MMGRGLAAANETFVRAALIGLGLVLIGGCSSGVVLDTKPPLDFSLGGVWVLDPLNSDPAPKPQQLRKRGFGIAMAAQDFPVMYTRRMRIEQSADSVGIEYDGGEYRDLSWGVRRRGLWEVNAGWEEGELLILSKAADAKARETLQLGDAGRRLVVHIEVSSDGQNLSLVRTFTRQAH
jgi:hypothetical protein